MEREIQELDETDARQRGEGTRHFFPQESTQWLNIEAATWRLKILLAEVTTLERCVTERGEDHSGFDQNIFIHDCKNCCKGVYLL